MHFTRLHLLCSLTERAQLLKNVFKKNHLNLYHSESLQQNLLRKYLGSDFETHCLPSPHGIYESSMLTLGIVHSLQLTPKTSVCNFATWDVNTNCGENPLSAAISLLAEEREHLKILLLSLKEKYGRMPLASLNLKKEPVK